MKAITTFSGNSIPVLSPSQISSATRITLKGVDTYIKEIDEKLLRFENLTVYRSLGSQQAQKIQGKKINDELRKLYREIMKQMDENGILQYIRQNLKQQIEYDWHN